MTHLRIHLLYLVLLGFLTYQYWTKTQALDEAVGSIEQFDKLLKTNIEVVGFESNRLLNELRVVSIAYPNTLNLSYFKKAQNVVSKESSISNWLNIQKSILENVSKKDTISLFGKPLNPNASKTFFSKQKIQEIQDSLYNFQRVLYDIDDTRVLNELKKQYTTLKLLKDNEYWQKLGKLTKADAFLQLSSIQNRMRLDEISLFTYMTSSFCRIDIKFDEFKVAIAPKKAVLLTGETFNADIYLASYSSRPGSDVTVWVNNQEVPVKDGVAHFENMEQSFGKKNIKAVAKVKNPLTGQVNTYKGEFEYEVLPKCRRDCK